MIHIKIKNLSSEDLKIVEIGSGQPNGNRVLVTVKEKLKNVIAETISSSSNSIDNSEYYPSSDCESDVLSSSCTVSLIDDNDDGNDCGHELNNVSKLRCSMRNSLNNEKSVREVHRELRSYFDEVEPYTIDAKIFGNISRFYNVR